MPRNSVHRNIRVLTFLDAYRKQECLWNHTLPNYKHKNDRNEAYLAIIKDLNIPTLTVRDIKLKVKGIRTTFTKELRVLLRHQELGLQYKPKLFWFKKANEFLGGVCVTRRDKKAFIEDPLSETELKNCTFEYVEQRGEIADHELTEEETMDTFSPASRSPRDIKIVPLSNNVMEPPVKDLPPERAKHPNNTYSKFPQDSIQTSETCSACKTPIQDDVELFCRSVAAQLRSTADAYSRSVAKLKIQQVLFEAETGQYKRTTSPGK